MKTITVSPEKLFFTADTHFGHKAMIEHGRKFTDVDQMDALMIDQWNSVVPVDGTVFHLGDVSFRPKARTQELLSQLNGTINLIPGNHDKGMRFGDRLFVLAPLVEIKVADPTALVPRAFPEFSVPEAVRIVLCHFPLHSWNRMHYGAWHLHGHSHGSMPGFGRRQDVGWDVCRAPISYQMLKSLIGDKQIKSFDHHQPNAT